MPASTSAGCLLSRTPAQCEELYAVHQAVLTSPAATAAALIAAMAEHYSTAELSDASQQTSSGLTDKEEASRRASRRTGEGTPLRPRYEG